MTGPEPRDAARDLAQRLRWLRENGLRSGKVTQQGLARALGVSPPLVSSWEKAKDPTRPPAQYIDAYARFFATGRSVDGGRHLILPRERLTPEEDQRRSELEAELMRLWIAADGSASQPPGATGGARIGENPWRFRDGRAITIVCAELPHDYRINTRYADPDDPDYVELYTYTDLDALVELHGHIRASNPDTNVYRRLASELEPDDYSTHLVLLGGVDWNPITRYVLDEVKLPVKQTSFLDDPDGAGFSIGDAEAARLVQPVVVERGGRRTLVEDVAHFFRGPNPFNRRWTVTVCNGMFGRGTYGVVRALTDAEFRDRNAEYLRNRFQGSDRYSVLTRVRVVEREVLTPDWTAEGTVLHEWPEAAA